MDSELLRSHWALLAATLVAAVLFAVFLVHRVMDSSGSRLRRVRRRLAAERRKLGKCQAMVAKAERRFARLQRRERKVKPRLLQEANGTLEDARALARIAGDRVMVAENHVRCVIVEEFPPDRHDELRNRYLPASPRDKRPFSF